MVVFLPVWPKVPEEEGQSMEVSVFVAPGSAHNVRSPVKAATDLRI